MQKSTDPLSIALLDMSVAGWTAGGQYQKNLCAALQSLPPTERPDIVFVTNNLQNETDLSQMGVNRVLLLPPASFFPGFWQRQRKRALKRLGIWKEPEHPLSAMLRRAQVGCVYGNELLPTGFRLPAISWLPDFQHLHLPELFSPQEIERRDGHYRRIAQEADFIVLSSQVAKADFCRSYPAYAAKARVVSFVAQIPDTIYNQDPVDVCVRYDLPDRFIFLPNQFWKHKNHTTVVQAVRIAKSRCPEIVVVCTGNTSDARDPVYFGRLLAAISSEHVRRQMLMLGLIPHTEMLQLMRQSLCVLQPSLFEGWSTTVEEVKSLGKRIILSDIAVHREQDPLGAVYFPPTDVESLAALLCDMFEHADAGPGAHLESAARQMAILRTKAFAQSFVHVVAEAASGLTDSA